MKLYRAVIYPHNRKAAREVEAGIEDGEIFPNYIFDFTCPRGKYIYGVTSDQEYKGIPSDAEVIADVKRSWLRRKHDFVVIEILGISCDMEDHPFYKRRAR